LDHREAGRKAKELLNARNEFAKTHLEGRPPNQVPEARKKEYQRLCSAAGRFGAQMNSDPELMDLLMMWTVSVRSSQTISQAVLGRIPTDTPVPMKKVREVLMGIGGMPRAVMLAIEDQGFYANACDLTQSGWGIGARTTEMGSRRLCSMLHRKFRKAISTEVIGVERWFSDFSIGHPEPVKFDES
jgi:hypothetical protein